MSWNSIVSGVTLLASSSSARASSRSSGTVAIAVFGSTVVNG
jgi:hypothetical protein